MKTSITDPSLSGASRIVAPPLPHLVRGRLHNSVAPNPNHDAQRVALDLDLRRPVKPRWHTEPKRGAEWWGKSVLLTFALFKSEPP
ncbi:hypothetical protein EUX57_16540 [Pseudomonas orientalis]|uniref:Uncharacterized protein n=1 Tax=Pseudomonas orientalis TaxID=76758 RepID=A0A4Q7CWE0_9PSED|nr:hypothetical protein EUX57_16540 [Pseudomonas orientalis]